MGKKVTFRRYERMTDAEIREKGMPTPQECMEQGIHPLMDKYGNDPYLKAVDTVVECQDD